MTVWTDGVWGIGGLWGFLIVLKGVFGYIIYLLIVPKKMGGWGNGLQGCFANGGYNRYCGG
jgi:hypothetical protein